MSEGQPCVKDWELCPCRTARKFTCLNPDYTFEKDVDCIITKTLVQTREWGPYPMASIKPVWNKDPIRWVPWQYIELPESSDIKYGNVTVAPGMPTSANPNITIDSGTGVFQNTLKGLLTAFWENRNGSLKDHISGSFVSKIDTEDKIMSSVGQIVAGVKAFGFLETLNDPNLDIWKIIRIGKSLTRVPNTAGLYMLIYWDFPSDSGVQVKYAGLSNQLTTTGNHTVKIYIGKTINYRVRRNQHDKSLAGDDAESSQHYSAVQNAGQKLFIPFCLAETADSVRSVIEQTLLSLFNCYSTRVLNAKVRASEALSSDVTPVAVWSDDINLAKALCQISINVFQRTGWHGYVPHPEFNQPVNQKFQVSHGLNWQSPLKDGGAGNKQGWILTRGPDRDFYRKIPVRATKNSRGIWDIWTLNCTKRREKDKYTGEHTIYPGKTDTMVIGTEVSIIFEIMHHWQPHPAPLARLPEAGPFMDPEWSRAKSIGCRLEWQAPDGKWRQLYHQLVRTFELRDVNVPGSLNPLATALGLIMYFRRMKYMEPLGNTPPWRKDFGLARIKESRYNHLKQAVEFKEQTSHVMADISLKDQYSDGLVSYTALMGPNGHGLSNINGLWAQYPDGKLPPGRLQCDRCRCSRDWRSCDRIGTTNQCKRCHSIGLPCSWTTVVPPAARVAFRETPMFDSEPRIMTQAPTLVHFNEDTAFSGGAYTA